MVGNFKEICPNFIILIFLILDTSKGNEENLRKQAQCSASVAPFSPWWRQGHEFQMDPILPTDACVTGAPGGRRAEDADSCPLRSCE